MAACVAALLSAPGLNVLSGGFSSLRQRCLQGVSEPESDGVRLVWGSASVMRLARPRIGLSSAMSVRFLGRRRDFGRKIFCFKGISAEEGARVLPMLL